METTNVVLGASPDPSRYSHLAVLRMLELRMPVLAIGRRSGMIGGVDIVDRIQDHVKIDTITLYLNASAQEQWHDRILAVGPRRIIFNPGAEHRAFAERAKAAGIEVVEACTLVMLATGQF